MTSEGCIPSLILLATFHCILTNNAQLQYVKIILSKYFKPVEGHQKDGILEKNSSDGVGER